MQHNDDNELSLEEMQDADRVLDELNAAMAKAIMGLAKILGREDEAAERLASLNVNVGRLQ